MHPRNVAMAWITALLLAVAAVAAYVWWPREFTGDLPGLQARPQVAWSIDVEGGVPWAVSRTELVVTGRGPGEDQVEVRMVAAADGREAWRSVVPGDWSTVMVRGLPGTDLVVVQGDGAVRLLSRSTGEVRHTYEVPSHSWYGATEEGTMVLAVEEGEDILVSRLRSTDPRDVEWSVNAGVIGVESQFLDFHEESGLLFVGETYPGQPNHFPMYLHAVHVSDGAEPEWVTGGTTVLSDGVAVVLDADGAPEGWDLDSGRRLWRNDGEPLFLLGDPDSLYEVHADEVRRLEPGTGATRWTQKVDFEAENAINFHGDLALLDFTEEDDGYWNFAVAVLDGRDGRVTSEAKLPLQTSVPAAGERQFIQFDQVEGSVGSVSAVGLDGRILWQYTVTGYAEILEGQLLVTNFESKLFALR